ncbi:MAG: hypothetical protein JWN74_1240 [Acidobacteriaceae bacterium]|nr:hypothetical protein [Acidobacteriaceae bacterium]
MRLLSAGCAHAGRCLLVEATIDGGLISGKTPGATFLISWSENRRKKKFLVVAKGRVAGYWRFRFAPVTIEKLGAFVGVQLHCSLYVCPRTYVPLPAAGHFCKVRARKQLTADA